MPPKIESRNRRRDYDAFEAAGLDHETQSTMKAAQTQSRGKWEGTPEVATTSSKDQAKGKSSTMMLESDIDPSNSGLKSDDSDAGSCQPLQSDEDEDSRFAIVAKACPDLLLMTM